MADLPPIIVKRIKKVAGGHHGGAWKVAYADFVTAMMAFFLLLWLLSVTTPEKRAAIADYFTPTIGIKDSKGIGVDGGINSSVKKGKSKSNLTSPGIVFGQVQQGPVFRDPVDVKRPDPNSEGTSAGQEDKQVKKDDKPQKNDDEQSGEDSDQFKLTEADINQAMQSDEDLKQLKNNVQVEQSAEGLKIDLIDDPKKPMFSSGGATLTEAGKKVLDSMANIISKTPNQLMIIGHTDTEGLSTNASYTNWELSADRANAVRRALVTTQLGADRVAKVVGLADRELLVKNEPGNPRNRRVTIILVRGSYVSRQNNKGQPIDPSIISVGDAQLKKEEPKKDVAPASAKPAAPSVLDVPNTK